MPKQNAHPEWLVESDWLAAHLDDPRLRIFDCTTHLRPDPATVYRVEPGRAGYEEAHIPGAGFIDIGDLSDNESPCALPSPARRLRRGGWPAGIGDGNRVILYTNLGPMGDPGVVAIAHLRLRQRRRPQRRLTKWRPRSARWKAARGDIRRPIYAPPTRGIDGHRRGCAHGHRR